MLDNIKQGNVEIFTSGAAPNPDVPSGHYEGKYRQRQVDLAIQLFELAGIPREDRAKRAEWLQRNLRFFDAPTAIILSADRAIMELRSQFDVGAITQTICLAALNYGLATCIATQCVVYPDIVRKFTHIPESSRIVVGIAIGYPDWDFPANRLQSQRETVENIVTWCGFD